MNPRDLAILDALGEATPEQRAQLAEALRDAPAFAAEHAEMLRLAASLKAPGSTFAPPPFPESLARKLDTMHAATPTIIPFPALRRFAPLAAAAAVALLAALGWLIFRAPPEGPLTFAQNPTASSEPESFTLSEKPAPAPAAPSGTRRALIVAVEPWPEKEKNPKRGSGWADAQLAKRTLIDSWGFAEKDIVVLFEDDATTANVVTTFKRHLIAPSQPGDVVVICWSSHGTQVTDFNGDEPDGLDEAYCTKDFAWNKPETWFTDAVFGSLLDQLRTKRVLVITDACHSGTSTRGAEIDDAGDIAKGISSGFTPLPAPLAGKAEEKPPVDAVLLAACQAQEVSYGVVGAPSHFFREIFAATSGRDGTTQTFAQAITKVRARIGPVFANIKKAKGGPLDAPTWIPQAEGPVDQRIADFLTPAPKPGVPDPTPPPTPAPPPLPVWQAASGDIAITLATDKLTYTEGDLIEIAITADRDCFLRLFYLGADRQTYQIFPNQYQPEAAVKKGETVRLGGAGGAFKLRAKAPFGNEILMAVASSRPFTDAESFRFQGELVKEFANTNLEALSHRGIGIEAGDAPLIGRALRLYRVEGRK